MLLAVCLTDAPESGVPSRFGCCRNYAVVISHWQSIKFHKQTNRYSAQPPRISCNTVVGIDAVEESWRSDTSSLMLERFSAWSGIFEDAVKSDLFTLHQNRAFQDLASLQRPDLRSTTPHSDLGFLLELS